MTQAIVSLILILCMSLTSVTISHAASLDVSGNYIYKGSSERLVLSFKEDGVVLFRRYSGFYTSAGVSYKPIPSESTWAPYIVNTNNLAKALICQYGNPKGHCSATEISVTGDIVKWGRISFTKTAESFHRSKFDKGPYSFEKLNNLYAVKMSIIK